MNNNKKFKVNLFILLMIPTIFFSFVAKNKVNKNSNVFLSTTNNPHLVLDSVNYNGFPKNFRKSSNPINIDNYKNLNITGLDKLNISGSQQFSEANLPLLVKQLDTSLPITIIDLREESHGFINGLPVSWMDLKNNANMGLSREQILSDESNRLASIKLDVPITFYNHPDKTIVPTKVQSENQLVTDNSLSYVRIPVTDGKLPTDDMVDYFVKFVKSHPEDTWLHFHCKQGIGRTTTFMIMYDMMKNSKEVPANDIIKRQLLLANFDENHIKSFYNNERTVFLETFYKYCKENGNSYNVKWSDWKKNSNTNNKISLNLKSLNNSEITSTNRYAC